MVKGEEYFLKNVARMKTIVCMADMFHPSKPSQPYFYFRFHAPLALKYSALQCLGVQRERCFPIDIGRALFVGSSNVYCCSHIKSVVRFFSYSIRRMQYDRPSWRQLRFL